MIDDSQNIFFFNGSQIVKHRNMKQEVYHYTSPIGLYSIFNNKKLWCTDCQFMNDRSEFVYIKKVLSKAFNQKDWNSKEDMEQYIDYIMSTPYESLGIKNVKSKPFSIRFEISRYYLFCTSLKKDSHNMWSYYIKNGNYSGYNMRFNVDKFVNLFTPLKDVTLIHGKVIYNEDEQIKQLRDELSRLDDKYNKQIEIVKGHKFVSPNGDEVSPEDIYGEEYQEELSSFLRERCLFFKSNAFESENEYRFAIKIRNDYDGPTLKLKHRIGSNGVIIPYREFDFEPKQIVDQITVSPMMEKEIAKEGLISMLGLSYKNQFAIEYSEINLRY